MDRRFSPSPHRAGLLRGVGLALFDAETTGMEVQCAAKGDTSCRFVVSAK
jgi:predicted hydrocarbon binding protein